MFESAKFARRKLKFLLLYADLLQKFSRWLAVSSKYLFFHYWFCSMREEFVRMEWLSCKVDEETQLSDDTIRAEEHWSEMFFLWRRRENYFGTDLCREKNDFFSRWLFLFCFRWFIYSLLYLWWSIGVMCSLTDNWPFSFQWTEQWRKMSVVVCLFFQSNARHRRIDWKSVMIWLFDLKETLVICIVKRFCLLKMKNERIFN